MVRTEHLDEGVSLLDAKGIGFSMVAAGVGRP
jgi:hypothetical protein